MTFIAPMPTQYLDAYMRDYPDDTGLVPSVAREGISASPDIIPIGGDPNPNYLTDYLVNFKGPYDCFQNINPKGYNYIYVRGYNAFPSAQSGSINLYYAPASLLLWPTVWMKNQIANTNQTTSAPFSNVASGAPFVAQGAFYWQPPSIAAGDHFCLISQVITQQDPDALPSTIADFAEWVANNADVAWRNVALVPASAPSYSAFVAMTNPVAQVNTYTLTLTCTDIPDGTVVSFLGTESAPVINWSATVGPSNQTGTSPKVNQMGTIVFNVPGNFSEAIQLSANSPSGFPSDAAIRFNYAWLVNTAHPLAALGVRPHEFNLQQDHPGVADGGVMLPMGDFTFQF